MPSVNVILQLYKDGWREQNGIPFDALCIEGLLGSGSVESEAEAERIALAQLELYAEPIESETVSLQPVGLDDTPWLSHVPGETIDLDAEDTVVESLSMRRDVNGHIGYFAELRTHIDTPEERFELASKKMSNGTFGGVSRVAQPVNQTPSATPLGPPAGALGGCACTWMLAQGDTDDSGNLSLVAATSSYKDLIWYGPPLEQQGGWTIPNTGGDITPPDPTAMYHIDVLVSLTPSSGTSPVIVSIQILDAMTTWIGNSLYFPTGFAGPLGIVASRDVALGQTPFGVSVLIDSANGAAATRSLGVYTEITAHVLCGCEAP